MERKYALININNKITNEDMIDFEPVSMFIKLMEVI